MVTNKSNVDSTTAVEVSVVKSKKTKYPKENRAIIEQDPNIRIINPFFSETLAEESIKLLNFQVTREKARTTTIPPQTINEMFSNSTGPENKGFPNPSSVIDNVPALVTVMNCWMTHPATRTIALNKNNQR
jgi:hypothetical protein